MLENLLLSAIRLYLEDNHHGWSARMIFDKINIYDKNNSRDFYIVCENCTIVYMYDGRLHRTRYHDKDVLSEISKTIDIMKHRVYY